MKRLIVASASTQDDSISKEVLRIRSELDSTGESNTCSKDVADMYRANKNPYKKFEVIDQPDGCYLIRVTASTEPEDEIFMLMEYDPGSPEDGIDADNFYCVGKFLASSLKDARDRLASLEYDLQFASGDFYVGEYNEEFDDGDEVYNSLDELFQDRFDFEHIGMGEEAEYADR